jgi:hypothetical protein
MCCRALPSGSNLNLLRETSFVTDRPEVVYMNVGLPELLV